MTILSPVWLWALLAAPVAAAAWFLTRRPKTVIVAHLPLWEEVLRESLRPGSRLIWLPPLPLLLGLAAFMCAALGASDPFLGDPRRDVRFHIFVDASPSMAAPGPDGRTRLDRALAICSRVVNALPAGSSVTIGRFSSGEVVAVNASEFARQAGTWKPDRRAPRVRQALGFLRGGTAGSAADEKNAGGAADEKNTERFLAITDGVAFRVLKPPEGSGGRTAGSSAAAKSGLPVNGGIAAQGRGLPDGVLTIRVGRDASNAGIVEASAGRDWATGQAWVRARAINHGDSATRLKVLSGTEPLADAAIIEPGQARTAEFSIPDLGDIRANVLVEPGGALAQDDRATLEIPGVIRREAIIVAGEGVNAAPRIVSVFRDALSHSGLISRVRVVEREKDIAKTPRLAARPFVVALAGELAGTRADLVFVRESDMPGTRVVRGVSGGVRVAGRWDRLLRGVDLADLSVRGDTVVFDPRAGVQQRVLARAAGGPLIVARGSGAGCRLLVGFPPGASSLEEHTVAFPLLLRNLLLEQAQAMARSDGAGRVQGLLSAGESDVRPTGPNTPVETVIRRWLPVSRRATSLGAWMFLLAGVIIALDAAFLMRSFRGRGARLEARFSRSHADRSPAVQG